MRDFIEILSFFGYDLVLAQAYIDGTYKVPGSVVDEVLKEAGLEHVEIL